MSRQLGTYDELAGEYYDSSKHPTCSNFRELSELFFQSELPAVLNRDDKILEVGAGLSIAAPIVHNAGIPLERLTLLDKSQKMLGYSKRWMEQGAIAIIADACDTGLHSSQFDVIVGSLIDPYNSLAFWLEVARLLRPGGSVLVTVPSPDWSGKFRSLDDQDKAEFELSDGRRVFIASFVPTVEQQQSWIESAGLVLDQIASFRSDEIHGQLSTKLLVATEQKVLNGFVAHLPQQQKVENSSPQSI
jgi:SAM-dependent methyltransferase